MPRPPRIHVGGGFYHVTLRGNHAQPIFFQPADRVTLESIVADTIPRCGARVHAYCWMTNHIHLLVQVGEIPLGRVILRIASRYARTVQARLYTTGHLFERRYHSVLVDADAYEELLNICVACYHMDFDGSGRACTRCVPESRVSVVRSRGVFGANVPAKKAVR